MSDILIFGGTTEGRELAQFCAENGIYADVCVATEYGASVLPCSEYLNIRTGRLDTDGMAALISDEKYSAVIDATHPYAEEVTRNIRSACECTGVRCYRLLREATVIDYGIKVQDMDELTEVLNSSDKVILSTLGSKEISKLTAVRNYHDRIWIRALPDEKLREYCAEMGYDKDKLILEKGPFSAEQNIAHIKQSGAEILVTKESGSAGGYAEKKEAAGICGIQLITIMRPKESGSCMDEIINMLNELKKEKKEGL